MAETASGNSVSVLDPRECEQLLASHDLGRVVVAVQGRPRAAPVHYVVTDGGGIVFQPVPGTVAARASLRDVTLVVDDADRGAGAVWCVEVFGFARDVSDALDPSSVLLRGLPIVGWADACCQQWMEIIRREVTGWRLASR